MPTLLDLIVKHILVADVPEVIIKDFLPGDDCLDDETIQLIFTIKYCRNGKTYMDEECTVLHSFDDKPAEIVYFGHYWYFNGRLHRRDGKPSIIYYDGSKFWYTRGKLFRVIRSHGYERNNMDTENPDTWTIVGQYTETWFYNDKLHSQGDQPALVLPDGQQEWYFMGKRHREGGKPAVIRPNGTKVYYVNGKKCARIKKVKK